MRLTSVLGGAALATTIALGSAGISGADDAAPTAKAAAAPKPAANKTFKGRTAQGKSFSFSSTSNRCCVRQIKFRFRWKCGGKTQRGDFAGSVGGVHRVRNGKFKTPADGFAVVTGKFSSSRKASGTLRVRLRRDGRTLCDSGTVKWSAKA